MFFLKKRTKKLLSVSRSIRAAGSALLVEATEKSFLLLFFKKEVLPYATSGKAQQ